MFHTSLGHPFAVQLHSYKNESFLLNFESVSIVYRWLCVWKMFLWAQIRFTGYYDNILNRICFVCNHHRMRVFRKSWIDQCWLKTSHIVATFLQLLSSVGLYTVWQFITWNQTECVWIVWLTFYVEYDHWLIEHELVFLWINKMINLCKWCDRCNAMRRTFLPNLFAFMTFTHLEYTVITVQYCCHWKFETER